MVSLGEETRDGKVHRRLELQITDMGLAAAKGPKPSEVLYPNGED